MTNKQIRIIPKLRKPDLDKLAEALLDLVDSLTPEEQDHFAAIGEQVLEQIESGSKPKGKTG